MASDLAIREVPATLFVVDGRKYKTRWEAEEAQFVRALVKHGVMAEDTVKVILHNRNHIAAAERDIAADQAAADSTSSTIPL